MPVAMLKGFVLIGVVNRFDVTESFLMVGSTVTNFEVDEGFSGVGNTVMNVKNFFVLLDKSLLLDDDSSPVFDDLPSVDDGLGPVDDAVFEVVVGASDDEGSVDNGLPVDLDFSAFTNDNALETVDDVFCSRIGDCEDKTSKIEFDFRDTNCGPMVWMFEKIENVVAANNQSESLPVRILQRGNERNPKVRSSLPISHARLLYRGSLLRAQQKED